MENVNKTRNGTAESAQSTPTHPWPTELHPRKLFVHSERFAHSFSWKQMGRQADYLFHSSYIACRQTIIKLRVTILCLDLHNYLPGILCKTLQSFSIHRFIQLLSSYELFSIFYYIFDIFFSI